MKEKWAHAVRPNNARDSPSTGADPGGGGGGA